MASASGLGLGGVACSALSLTASSGSSAASELEDVHSVFKAMGFKHCPRCMAIVEKMDHKSCDHMTCTQCRHEFCWTCLADRIPISAHGNHFHRPTCTFYAAYAGPLEYRPEQCRRCAHRGAPCVPGPGAVVATGSMGGIRQLQELDAWFWRLVQAFTLQSCQIPAHG